MRWDLVWRDVQDANYTWPFMLLLALAVLIMGLRRHKQLFANKYLVLHAAATVMQAITMMMSYIDTLVSRVVLQRNIEHYSQTAFLFIELAACSLFIAGSIALPKLKKMVLGLAAITAIGILVFMVAMANIATAVFYSFAIENVCITCCCLIYCTDLLRQPSKQLLGQSPAFWAISAMLLLFAVTTPLFIFYNFLGNNYALENVFFINYLMYCVLYIGYLKALRVAGLGSKERLQ
jgi:hypothetical protein